MLRSNRRLESRPDSVISVIQHQYIVRTGGGRTGHPTYHDTGVQVLCSECNTMHGVSYLKQTPSIYPELVCVVCTVEVMSVWVSFHCHNLLQESSVVYWDGSLSHELPTQAILIQ